VTRSRRRRRGFTLVELLAGMTLSLFLVLGMEIAWWNATKSAALTNSQLALQRDAAFVLASISDSARKAGQATISNYGNKTSNLVILKNGAGVEFARYYWNPSNNQLMASTNAGTASTFVASAVQNLSFSLSGKDLTMNITLNDALTQTAPFTSIATLRN
jgi:prepilin-type N-terminal cleavage/methylation domain-containing protein